EPDRRSGKTARPALNVESEDQAPGYQDPQEVGWALKLPWHTDQVCFEPDVLHFLDIESSQLRTARLHAEYFVLRQEGKNFADLSGGVGMISYRAASRETEQAESFDWWNAKAEFR